jgi:hypothetical protein
MIYLREGSTPLGRDAFAARFTRAWSTKVVASQSRFILLQPDSSAKDRPKLSASLHDSNHRLTTNTP